MILWQTVRLRNWNLRRTVPSLQRSTCLRGSRNRWDQRKSQKSEQVRLSGELFLSAFEWTSDCFHDFQEWNRFWVHAPQFPPVVGELVEHLCLKASLSKLMMCLFDMCPVLVWAMPVRFWAACWSCLVWRFLFGSRRLVTLRRSRNVEFQSAHFVDCLRCLLQGVVQVAACAHYLSLIERLYSCNLCPTNFADLKSTVSTNRRHPWAQ